MPEIRLDRIATLYFVRPLRQLVRSEAPGLPILMYHSISAGIEAGRSAYYRTCTDPSVFAAQMAFLARSGYRTIGLGEAANRIDCAAPEAKHPVVLTFDDGYQDFYTNAFPILSRYGYSATVFLPTAYIGHVSQGFNGTECLTWSQVRELRQAGVEFGSHTVTHPQLLSVGPKQLREEITASKEQIEEKLGEPVEAFSYPYAFPEADRGFVGRLRERLQESGYRQGVSTIIGRAGKSDSRLFMKRLPINSHDDARFFRAKLEGGYDWLHAAQYATKLWKTDHTLAKQ